MWHILVQVVEAARHGEDGHGNEEDPGEAAHPGSVVQAVGGQEDCPHWQPTLIQLQQPLIVLHTLAVCHVVLHTDARQDCKMQTRQVFSSMHCQPHVMGGTTKACLHAVLAVKKM